VFRVVGEDEVSEAQIALHRALLYTDPEKGGPFRVAVWFLIRRRQTRHGIHIPHNVRQAFVHWCKGDNTKDLDGTPLTPLRQEELIRVSWLMAPFAGEVDERTSWLVLNEEPDPHDMDVGPDLEQLRELLAGMSDLRRDAILASVSDDMTYGAIATEHGLSRERVRQIARSGLIRLRELFQTEPGP
jgi:DNA-directed RNA polymerase specialized sigma24 family protein